MGRAGEGEGKESTYMGRVGEAAKKHGKSGVEAGVAGLVLRGEGGGGKLLSGTEPVSHSLAVLSILYCISVSMTAFTFITAVTPVDR